MPFVLGKTITEIFLKRVEKTPDRVGFVFKMGNAWKELSFRAFHDECRLVSFGLMGLGVEHGDKVALLSQTRLEWSLADMAILGAGAVTVPVYPSNTTRDTVYLLNHSEAKVVVLEDGAQLRKILEARREDAHALPFLKRIVVIEPSAMNFASPDSPGFKDILTFAALLELGRREQARDTQKPDRFEGNLRGASPEELMTICYTSGTTAVPKGAMITHDNMISVLEDCVAAFGGEIRPERETVLSFLPFSHILGKVESMATHTFGWRQVFAESMEKLPGNLLEVRPTILFSVPRMFEKAYAKVLAKVAEAPARLRTVFKWAETAGYSFHSALSNRKQPTLREIGEYAVARTLIFRKVREGFGGRLRFAVCGGAPLSKEIGEFFQVAGVRILEGYGLTETCAPVTLNPPNRPLYGTVGKPLTDVSIRIEADGEVLIKSRKVFRGYYKMPEETAEALRDGWFHTGDIGEIDDEGYLRITDRKKDLIVTSGGKNIPPQKVENLAKVHKMIQHFVVLGDRRNYLTALLTLDREQVIRYASENQILFSEYSELIKNPRIIGLVQKMVDEVNSHLAGYEAIKKFLILPNEFTIDSGELTPSLKIKRKIISDRYRRELDNLYS